MAELRVIDLKPVQLSIEPKTRLLVLKQGDNEVKLTRDDIPKLTKLRKGELKDLGGKTLDVYTTALIPRNRCTVAENGTITIICRDDWEDNVVTVANHKKLDDLQRIQDFVGKNKARIAWNREFKGKY